MTLKPLILLAIAASISLAGCGGDSTAPVAPPDPPTPPAPPPVYADATPGAAAALRNLCEVVRPGSLVDRHGTQADEKGYIRAVTQETYLWSAELPDTDPTTFPTVLGYFNALKTPKLTASGRAKDRFHYSYSSERYESMVAGVDIGYGVTWLVGNDNKVPRFWRVAFVEPDSPAATAGLRRGDQLVMIDKVDFINRGDVAGVALLNAGLAPLKVGEQHTFTVWRGGAQLAFALTAGKNMAPVVQNTQVFDTPTGKLGYLTFNNHNKPAEKQLYDAFSTLKAAAVNDLIIDMRYNGGGLVSVASELAYMVAGTEASNGKTFMQYTTNGVLSAGRPTPFYANAVGLWTDQPLIFGTPLPSLNLKHVTVLTGPNTCSASEAVINGLRGIGVAVDLVGGRTCGKPYAFVPLPNCGTTYFMVQFQLTNQQGWGDYTDGFAPTCAAEDDLSHPVGDPAEGLLAQAIRLHNGEACPAPGQLRQAGRQLGPASTGVQNTIPPRPEVKEIAILPSDP